ncbi:hypothetical protein EYF80_013056 [Liparis tanakae]|uniref:Uncharacterized protein n=1 Tax=Liparis tanakae TaxID=230148 RepID=A0A4Z2IGP0_9TELE|nr:hypothetical protein EYF80_013056 [Liparis tanakae]
MAAASSPAPASYRDNRLFSGNRILTWINGPTNDPPQRIPCPVVKPVVKLIESFFCQEAGGQTEEAHLGHFGEVRDSSPCYLEGEDTHVQTNRYTQHGGMQRILHWVGRGLWRVGEVWGDDSLSEEVDDVREDCRWTVLWKSLLLIRTTREKRRSWKWLKEWGGNTSVISSS